MVRFLVLWLTIGVVALGSVAFDRAALGGEVTPVPGLVREPMVLTGPHGRLEALAVRPEAAGRYPLALITHGLPRDPSLYAMATPEGLLNPAIAFAVHGYASVVVMRSGYGDFDGPFQENLGACNDRH